MTLYFISFFKSIYIYIIHYVIYIYNIHIYILHIILYYIILYTYIYILRYITHITVWYVYFDIGSPSAWECLNGLLRANLGIWSCTFQTAHLDLVAAFDVSLSADKPRGSNKCNFTIHWWNVTINWGKFHHQLVELACILMRMSSKTFYKPKRVGVQLTLNILELWFNVVNGTFHVASIHGFIPYSPSCGPDKANGIWRGSVEHVGIFHSNDSLHLEAWRTAKKISGSGMFRWKQTPLRGDFERISGCRVLHLARQDPFSEFSADHEGWKWFLMLRTQKWRVCRPVGKPGDPPGCTQAHPPRVLPCWSVGHKRSFKTTTQSRYIRVSDHSDHSTPIQFLQIQ